MHKMLPVLFISSCTLCAGQSNLTPPDNSTQLAPTIPPATTAPSADKLKVPNLTEPRAESNEVAAPRPSSRIIGPITTKTDFELFAEDAAGRSLPVYGRSLFDEVPSTFAPLDHIPVPANYVIGPGDELLIQVWGRIDLKSRTTVDRDGQISLPKVGTLSVAGLRYEQLEGYLRSSIANLYKDFELNVTLGRLRSIQVYVFGSARQPGAYTVSSLSTLVNGLFDSGGPSATGTMRHIQLLRNDHLVADFDVYDLLRKGDKSHDVQLLPGDVIYIPPAGPQIAMIGSVNEPGIYELKFNDETIASALKDAGGLTSLAEADRILLERIENRRRRWVDEFALDVSGLQRVLKDGDILRIFPISPRFENAVTLRGNVAQPGRYAWHEGMRISDLIPSRNSLITRDYWNLQNHLFQPEAPHPFANPRTDRIINPCVDPSTSPRLDQSVNSRMDQSASPRADQLVKPRSDQFGNPCTDQFGNPLSGQIGNERTDQLGNQRTDQTDQLGNQRADQAVQFGKQRPDHFDNQRADQFNNQRTDRFGISGTSTIATIAANSAEINWEYAVIERLDEQDLSTRLIPFRLASVVDNPASSDNQVLKAGDVITIFSRADLDLPMEKHASFIRIGGEVNAPGVYRIDAGDTLRKAVERAGGLTPHSYLYASTFTRVSTRHAQEEQLKQSTEQMQKELVSRYATATPANGQTAADQQVQLGLQQSALAQLSAIKPTGRVVLAMKPSAATIRDIPDFPLEDGDTFYIPPRLSTVQVAGAVYNTNSFRYQSGKTLVAYLNDAGGPTREADRKRIFVIRADGTVISRQSKSTHMHNDFEKLRLLPGDAIVVPERIRTSGAMKEVMNFAQLISSSALTAALIGTAVP